MVNIPINNYLISEDYLKELLPKLKSDLQEICKAIYYMGAKVENAHEEFSKRTIRACQIEIKNKTNSEITLRDLRLSYQLRNPYLTFKRLAKRTNKKRKAIPIRIRWNVLMRDNFRCKNY